MATENMLNQMVFDCVKRHGQIIDRYIAKELSLTLDEVRVAISELQITKKLYTCDMINFEDGVEMSGLLCRISGYAPPLPPGRKSQAAAK